MKRCFECRRPAEHDHHVVPRSRGGTRTIPLCGECHGKVHGRRAMSTSALTKEALRRRKEAGLRTGSIPFGFDLAGDRLVRNPVEQEALLLMQRMRASGAGLAAIAAHLTSLRVRPKRGKKWY